MQAVHYAELVCQSNFSFLTGASHPQELVRQANALGYSAIAITDECSLAGVVRAHATIKNESLPIRLIIGSLLRLPADLTLVLLCPCQQAYTELCRVITNARRRSPKGEYRLHTWDLRSIQHCLAIWLPQGQTSKDGYWGRWLTQVYGSRLYLGLHRQLTANEADYLQHCETLANKFDLPIVACGRVLMHHPERLPLQQVLSAIRKGVPVAQMGRELLSNAERALRPLAKLRSLYSDEWLNTAHHIAQRCSFNLSDLKYQYPKELVPAGKTPYQHLRELVLKGMRKRFAEGEPPGFKLKRVIIKELRLIRAEKYEAFFLTIADIVHFAQRQRILYQGRGSAANSIVCYCLAITAVDPRQVDLLFERFISKERKEPPDIDVDFEHERREEIIQYIYQKYGRERTALAATVITYRTKSAIREVGKALGLHETQLDFFIKNINHRDHEMPWQQQIAELGLAPTSVKGKQLINLVETLKGFPRHLSQHVGGFVISEQPMYHLVPIENAAMPKRSVIQWDKDDLESLTLLKVDVLALGMLTAIRKTFTLLQRHYERSLSIADITRMGDDKNVYRMIQRADTVGVFQIESRAQMSMLPRLKPAEYYDLVIQIAIVRPGPIQGGMVHPFLKRRDGLEESEAPSAEIADILSRTMGVPIFQEQVIKIAMVAAGFTGGEADQLRRAMGSWKKTGELERFGVKLIDGMRARGYSAQYAEQIFNQIKGFGEYGFPESHSASFAVLAYVSSWLKHYYPEAFYVGLLNSWPMGFYAPPQLIKDARHHGVIVLPVCVNHSDYDHQLEWHQDRWAIRLGFRLIKGLSTNAAMQVVKHRPSEGYSHMAQISQLALPQSQREALASADAFNCLMDNRYAARWQMMNSDSELPLFKKSTLPLETSVRQPNNFEALLEDYAATGLSLNTHPISLLRQAGLLKTYTAANQLLHKDHQSAVSVVGLVIGRQRPGTSKGVTFMTLEDDTGNINVIVWLATARAQKKAFLKSTLVRVNGLLERGDGGVTHIIAGRIEDLSHLLNQLNNKSRDFH